MRHFEKPRFPCSESQELIKLIYDTVDVCNFVINEFNPTFEVQNMGNEAFQNASFGNASFGNGNEDSSCLRAEHNLSLVSNTHW